MGKDLTLALLYRRQGGMESVESNEDAISFLLRLQCLLPLPFMRFLHRDVFPENQLED